MAWSSWGASWGAPEGAGAGATVILADGLGVHMDTADITVTVIDVAVEIAVETIDVAVEIDTTQIEV